MTRILVVGAHPDDCDLKCGGSAVLWRRRGDHVRFVSLTDGRAGHHAMEPDALAARRADEAANAARIADIEYQIVANADGELEPTIQRRQALIRLIRSFEPDLVLTHRPGDYHPDHRYTSLLVQDSAYMVTVPLVCRDTPHLDRNPVFGYLADHFLKPTPFRPDVIVDVEPAMQTKWEMLNAHESQFYEWLPYNDGTSETVPEGDDQRREWLRGRWGPEMAAVAEVCRDAVLSTYGARGAGLCWVEAFEISEYGRQPTATELRELFPIDVCT